MIQKVKNMVSKKPKFYSLERIKKKDAVYNVIFGERSNGKTYAALKESVEQYFEHGGQVGIVRRWQEDIKGKRASGIFSALNENGEILKISSGKYEGVTYYSGRFYVCNYGDNGKPIYSDDDCIGHVFALSDSEHNKSISFPKITTIIFDEFLTKHTYLQDEFVLFMNTVSTIVRQRKDVKIYMLGNTVNKYCPYFTEMGLNHITKMEQGTIDVYKYGKSGLTVAVEYCESTQKSKDNNFYFAFNNPKLEMITSGAWELDMYPHIPYKYKPKNVMFTYYIEFSEQLFSCDVVQLDEVMFTYITRKTTPLQRKPFDLIYTFEPHVEMNYSRNIYKPTNVIQQKVLWFFENGRIYYQDNEVGDTISNYLKVCMRGG